MYIVVIGWMYVVTLMSATETNFTAGIATFVFYGLLPCSLLAYIFSTKSRRLKKQAQLPVAPPLQTDPQAVPLPKTDGENASADR